MRPTVLAAAALVVLAAPPLLACGNSMRWERERLGDEMRIAESKLRARDFQEALRISKSVMNEAERPGDLRRARKVAGLALLGLARPGQAVPYFEALVQEDADNAFFAAKLGEALVGAGRVAEGRERLEKLAGADMIPDADGWVALAKARRDADRAGALTAVRKALAIQPKHAAALALESELAPRTPPPSTVADGEPTT